MIDQILSARSTLGENEVLNGFTPEQAITDTRLTNSSAPTLTVVFPPWHGAVEVLKPLEKKIAAQGSAVLAFSLHDHILEPNVSGVEATYTYLQETISAQVNELHKKNNYQSIHLISMSLGIVPLMMTAGKLDFFTRATLVVAGSSLAGCFWYGARTQKMRQTLEQQGVTLEQLQEDWAKLEPNYYAPAMRGKDVHMLISESDTITPLSYAEEFKQDLIDAGANVSDTRLKVGHVMSIVKFCLLPKGSINSDLLDI